MRIAGSPVFAFVCERRPADNPDFNTSRRIRRQARPCRINELHNGVCGQASESTHGPPDPKSPQSLPEAKVLSFFRPAEAAFTLLKFRPVGLVRKDDAERARAASVPQAAASPCVDSEAAS